MSGTTSVGSLPHCPYCSTPNNYVYHYGPCPKIKSIEYYPSGTIKKIEYKDPVEELKGEK